MPCHSDAEHSGGLVFETYQQIAESSKSGELYNSVVSINGYLPKMPKGKTLTNCQIQTIKNWYDQGSNNN